ncbi:MAG: hypothetical protein ABII02_01595 [Candidatus Magasanikbacteria bacterium]
MVDLYQQQKWAAELRKRHGQVKKTKKTPLKIQERQISEELSFFKRKLAAYLEIKYVKGVEETLSKLFKTRAKMLAIKLEGIKFMYNTPYVDTDLAEEERIKYERDCERLISSAAHILMT